MVIRTPDQRPRVFVTSTLGELAEERRAVAGHLGAAADAGDVRGRCAAASAAGCVPGLPSVRWRRAERHILSYRLSSVNLQRV